MDGYRRLLAYQTAYKLAMEIFQLTRDFPSDEKFGLTNQIRRSSRSVCTNLAEAFAKRRYPAHFISKISDADGENTETSVWLDFTKDCQYISSGKFNELRMKVDEIGRLLGDMLNNPNKYRTGWI